ncbi:hypothetical protein WA171_006874 [Blastocystis sp. BT1]
MMNFTASLGITPHSRQKQEEAQMQAVWEESLQTVRREALWFQAASRGTDTDIEKMAELLCEDPNRFYSDWDPRKLLNCVDSRNRTAMYLACTDCNLQLLRFLISKNADPRIAYVIDEKTEETPLGCAVRWGYTEVAKLLLEKSSYCKAEIKTIARLRKRCRNKEIGALLKEKYSIHKDELNKTKGI